MSQATGLIWHNPAWQHEAHDWIRAQANQQGLTLTGEIEQPHTYAWSTVMRVPSQAGRLFFKATAPETRYEIALTQKLAGWYPACLPELVAVDTARGWMLMRDGGEQLRTFIRPTQDIRPWEPVIPRYAELQLGLAQHVEEILALGLPDHRPAALPQLYVGLLADTPSLMIDQEKGLTSAEFRQLQSLSARVEQICAELTAYGIPDSLDHGDFHDGNVLVKDGRITFFDWGDASLTHPFVSLRTFFVSIEISLKLEGDYPPPTSEMTALLQRYLQAWAGFAEPDRLQAAYLLSRPVASIVKALQWHQGITHMPAGVREEYAWIVPEVLREFMLYEQALTG